MRHFEDFEIEHLFHSTGSFWFRLRIRLHLRGCELCRTRYEHLLADRSFAEQLRKGLAGFEEKADSEDRLPPEKS